jgi:hypothetical protein
MRRYVLIVALILKIHGNLMCCEKTSATRVITDIYALSFSVPAGLRFITENIIPL